MKASLYLFLTSFGFLLYFTVFAQRVQKKDSILTVIKTVPMQNAPDNNTVLLQYEKLLNDDMKAHRDYVDTLLKYLFYFIIFIGTAFSGLLVFFSRKSYRDWERDAKRSLNELYENNSKKILDAHLQDKMKELETQASEWQNKMATDFKIQLERQIKESEIRYSEMTYKMSGKMTSLSNIFRELAIKIPSKSTIRKSRVTLRYLKPDGSMLSYEKYQELICESENDPVNIALENLAILEPGAITDIDAGSENAEITHTVSNAFNIVYTFDPPMKLGDEAFIKKVKCKLHDAFTADKEWLVISQITPCRDEQYILHFLKERPCKQAYLEKLDFKGDVIETSYEGIKISDSNTGQVFTVVIPTQEPPYKYRIVWEF